MIVFQVNTARSAWPTVQKSKTFNSQRSWILIKDHLIMISGILAWKMATNSFSTSKEGQKWQVCEHICSCTMCNPTQSPACVILFHLFTLLLAHWRLQTTFQHGEGISELSSRFTSSCLTQPLAAWHPGAPCRALSTAPESLQDCTWDHCVVLGDTNQRQQRKLVRCPTASCISLCSSNQESQKVTLLCWHGWHFWQCGMDLDVHKDVLQIVRDGRRRRKRGRMRGEVKGLALMCVLSRLWNCLRVCVSCPTRQSALAEEDRCWIKQLQTAVYIQVLYPHQSFAL